jgi:ribosomal protein S12 methylthiotransferase
MPKVGLISLGCPKNLVDSEVMLGLLQRAGYEITADADQADILIVNTCSFIGPAQEESAEAILEMAERRRQGRAQRLVVTGCLVERYGEEIRREIPEVDAVLGTGEVAHIVEAVQGIHRSVKTGTPEWIYDDSLPRLRTTPAHIAYIKINEGCDRPCSFCIIPQLRGRMRSRTPQSILREARRLVTEGVRELILVGQDTTGYGEDLGLRDGLPDLLRQLAALPGPLWIRFLYCYPNRVSQRLLEVLASHPHLVKYLDIPLQHASRSVLARMRRGGNGEVFLRLLERIRSAVPGVWLRSTFIVGFPGETDEDFRELCDFVQAAAFDWAGVFAYSDQETAASYQLEDKVPEPVIAERRQHLLELQQRITRQRLRQRVGQICTALLDGPSSESEFLWEARLEGMAPDIDGRVLVTEFPENFVPRAGAWVRLHVTRAAGLDLLGRVLEPIHVPAVSAAARTAGPILPVLP